MANEEKKQGAKDSHEGKWVARGRRFWSAFLFTKDGKPKSSLLIYTFCLSFVFFGIMVALLFLLIDYVTPLVAPLPIILGNLVLSVSASGLTILTGWILHHFLKDKRLVLGAYLWLALYLVAMLVGELAILWGQTAAIVSFLSFYLWFGIIPVLSGLAAFYALYRRDYRPPVAVDDDPVAQTMRRYVNRR